MLNQNVNYGRKFSNKEVAVRVKNISEIERAARVVNMYLFEDTSVINAKLYHGVYNRPAWNNVPLFIGLTSSNMVEVLSNEYFESNNYELLDNVDDFVENLLMW